MKKNSLNNMASRNSGLRAAVFFCMLILAKTSDGWIMVGDECWNLGSCGWIMDCVNYACTCRTGYVPSADKSTCVIDINEQCISWSDTCYDPNAYCDRPNTWQCICKENFSQHTESQLCYHDLGTICEANEVPCIDGSCIDGTCQCGAGLTANQLGNRCGIAVGGSCIAGGTVCADNNAECSSGNTCECTGEYQRVVNADGLTVCQKRLGTHCSSTDECAPASSSCETMLNGKKICTCNVGYVPSGERTSCLQVTDHWPGACQEDTQCTAGFGRHSLCQSNACVCANGYTYSFEDYGCIL